MAQDMAKFSNKDEEIKFWRERATEWEQKANNIERDYDDYREQSTLLEKELERDLDQGERTIRELRTKCNRLNFDLDSSRETVAQLTKENAEFLKEILKYRESEEKLLKIIRELEQKNDDIERLHRTVMVTVEDIQVELDKQIEKNAFLETELDEKDALHVMVQRLKDEQRDLQQELARQLRQRFPDNDKVLDSRIPRTPTFDSNKLQDGDSLTTPSSPVKSKRKSLITRALSESCFRSPEKAAARYQSPVRRNSKGSWTSHTDLPAVSTPKIKKPLVALGRSGKKKKVLKEEEEKASRPGASKSTGVVQRIFKLKKKP